MGIHLIARELFYKSKRRVGSVGVTKPAVGERHVADFEVMSSSVIIDVIFTVSFSLAF